MKKISILILLSILLFTACTEENSKVEDKVNDVNVRDVTSETASEEDLEFSYLPPNVIKIDRDIDDFTLENLDGDKVSLSDYKGKVVLMNFWTTWCKYCVEEMPDFNQLNSEIKDSEDVAILMINPTDGVRETKENSKEFLKEHNFEFNVLFDENGALREKLGVRGYPITFVINKEGKIKFIINGATDYDTLQQAIEEAS